MNMNKLLKLDDIMFRVRDLEKSTRFYEEVLGLKKAWEDKNNHMVGFIFPESDSEIVIHTDPSLPNFDYSFLVKNVVGFCQEFESQGYKVAEKPITVRTGMFAVLSDPDGNRIPIIDLTRFGGIPRYD